ncbi:MAG TPA: N-carbamoylputrescine amidase [Syntrophomonadaceae bacterium]|nr:N-carbamoylputrescine amidase [Syntrophomonadaceae bacterium]
MRQVTVAAVQMSCSSDTVQNMKKAEELVRRAAREGAGVVVLPELFETTYFCQQENPDYYQLASTLETNPAVQRFKDVARELGIVLPISFFEKKNYARYNSVAVIDAGQVLGVYRKSHIPAGPGYQEKFYFNPGDTGFKVWETRFGRIGVGICWDQWYPEAARCMTLMGAEMLLYPTAIGSEPQDPSVDSRDHWQICMRGHAAANLIPVVAANRVGQERDDDSVLTFYGSSFIAGPTGNLLAAADRAQETVITARFDLDGLEHQRLEWGIFRDRRPELYRLLVTSDGEPIV